ncbi:MAG TPA: diacylglycerol kinase family protein [Cyclobacteriaceae bacterium]|nr:diacylglycerol kinase family protein [Cyclobacteriaceae bacterium]
MNTAKYDTLPGKVKKLVYLIINPVSGTKTKTRIPGLVEQLSPDEYNIEVHQTSYPGHAFEIAATAARNEAELVIVAGGDGTINEAGRALINSGIALGIIPAGSGNGLARHLGIPMNSQKALEVIRRMNTITIDAGTVNGYPFFCTAGIGFDAYIGKEFKEGRSRGLYGYANHVFREYFRYRSSEYSVRSDGIDNRESAFIITIANAGQWGNNACIAPGADISDGYLDLCIVKKFPKLKGIGMGLKLFNKSISNSPYYSSKKIRSARINADNDHCYHLDGEVFALNSNLEIGIIPQCLKVIAP